MVSVLRVAIVGAGPQGTAVLARLVARAAGLPPGGRLRIDVIDPGEPGAGLVWDPKQSPHLLMNSPVDSVDFFPSAAPGAPPTPDLPPLTEWLDRSGGRQDRACPGFAARATVGRYLAESFRALRSADPAVQITVHHTSATRLRTAGGAQLVSLESGPVLAVDAVVLAQGHLPVRPTTGEQALTRAAARGGWAYHPPGPLRVAGLDAIGAGTAVAVRGLGLAAIDLVAVLTHGRGGEFVAHPDGRLRYLRSGREPVLYVGSRTGLAHRSKPPVGHRPAPLELAQFVTVQALEDLGRPLDFRHDIWPRLQADLVMAYYRQVRLLGAWDPRVDLARLAAVLRRHAPDSAEVSRLTALAVRDQRYRDPDRWWRGRRPGDGRADPVAAIRADLDQVLAADYPAQLAARSAFIRATESVAALEFAGWIHPVSLSKDVHQWFWPLASALTSGPPRGRLEQLLALVDSGIVRMLGADMSVAVGRTRPTTSGRAHPRPVTVDAIVEARLPRPDPARTSDPLVADLLRRGTAVEMIVCDDENLFRTGCLAVNANHRVVDVRDRADSPVWAVGPGVRVVDHPSAHPVLRLEAPVDTTDALCRDLLAAVIDATSVRRPDVFAPAGTTHHTFV